MSELTDLSLTEAFELSHEILRAKGFSEVHAEAIARNIVRAQIDECQSHGLYRLLMCAQTAQARKVSLYAISTVRQASANVVKVDAHSGFSLVTFDAGLPILAAMAKETGMAAMAINRCFHFSALWPEVEDLARQGLAAIAILPSHSCVAPAGGSKAVFGTNPFAFAWPRGNERPPYAFDFATSASARGEIEVHRRAGKPLPEGWAIDSAGQPTTNPVAALAGCLLPFGGHKGSALSTMIVLRAGAMISDFLSMDALEHSGTLDTAPCHGELVLAFYPTVFGDGDLAQQTERAERLFAAITAQGARLPSARRFSARAKNLARGAITITRQLRLELETLRDN